MTTYFYITHRASGLVIDSKDVNPHSPLHIMSRELSAAATQLWYLDLTKGVILCKATPHFCLAWDELDSKFERTDTELLET